MGERIEIQLSTLRRYADTGSRFTCPFVGIPLDGQVLIMKRKYLTAALSAPTVEAAWVGDRRLHIEGQRSRYAIVYGNNPREFRDEIRQWAAVHRKAIRRKADPAFRAQEQAGKLADVNAKYWAKEHGYRGVNDAREELAHRIGETERGYHAAMKRRKEWEPKVPRPREEWEPQLPTPTERREGKRKAKAAGEWLARKLAERKVRGAFDWTPNRGELAAILGLASLPSWSQLTTGQKRHSTQEVACGYIRGVMGQSPWKQEPCWGGSWWEWPSIAELCKAYCDWQDAKAEHAEFVRVLAGEGTRESMAD